jgi:hypothetical protein
LPVRDQGMYHMLSDPLILNASRTTRRFVTCQDLSQGLCK